jgi:cell division transport system ATP-binding protein
VVGFERVTKSYPNGVTALRDVTLHIAAREFVFIVGPTGAGKSTLLKMIYRDERPTSGRVLVDGRDITRLPARRVPFLRRRVGVVFQDQKLLPRRTARENVAFALEVTGVPPREVDDRVEEVLDVVGLAARADALPGDLSAGERQRVGIARALVHRPPLLVADEPTGTLDPDSAWEIVQLLSQINLRGTTLVVATREKTMVDILRRRVIALGGGTVVRDQPRGLYAGGG